MNSELEKKLVLPADLPCTIAEEIERATEESRRTGKRIHKRFNKREFLEQFPHASSDPRMALTPDEFFLDLEPLEGLTVGELRNLCLKKKDHPLALLKAMQVEGYPDSTEIFILKEEIAILSGDD
jgi:hypothetical protein